MTSGKPDDATTVMTKEEPSGIPKHKPYPAISKEPIFRAPDQGNPVNQVEADDN